MQVMKPTSSRAARSKELKRWPTFDSRVSDGISDFPPRF